MGLSAFVACAPPMNNGISPVDVLWPHSQKYTQYSSVSDLDSFNGAMENWQALVVFDSQRISLMSPPSTFTQTQLIMDVADHQTCYKDSWHSTLKKDSP